MTIEVLAAIVTVSLLLLRRKKYNFSYKMVMRILIIVGVFGYFGASISSRLTFGKWSGIRFYGRVLFATLALQLMAKYYKINTFKLMDFYAPVDIAALAIMKIGCYKYNCCAGIELFYLPNRGQFIFPSQIAEFVFAVGLLMLILSMEAKNKLTGKRYSIYLIIYGASRVFFDFFRAEKGNVINLGMIDIPLGQIICGLLVVIGIMYYQIADNKHEKDIF